MQETTTIVGSTTYLRKAGLSRKHLQKKRQQKKKAPLSGTVGPRIF